MITARFAGEQGRQLMVVPGRIDQASSVGCHQLLRDGATLVTSVDDILEELRYARPVEQDLNFDSSESSMSMPSLSSAELAVLGSFQGGNILFLDEMAQQLGSPASEIAATLMGLELKRLVVKRADGSFEAH
jgi:DNA processing protein